MDPDLLGQFFLIAVLTLLNAFFASAEMAIVSVNKNKIRLLSEQGNKNAILLLELTEEPTKFLSTIQVGITLAGFFSSAFAASGMSDDLGGYLSILHIPYSKEIALVIITIVLSYITLVFGELFPKRVALQNTEKIALFSVRPIYIVSKFTAPFVKLLSLSTGFLLKITRMDRNTNEKGITEQELLSIINEAESDGSINKYESQLIRSAIEFNDVDAIDIITPRVDIIALPVNATVGEIEELFLIHGYSRLPVYKTSIDNIIGVIHEKDFHQYMKNGKTNIAEVMKEIVYTTATAKISNLLKHLQHTKTHIAVVVDEFGGTLGIVTLEDILEELVGDIWDEHDEIITSFLKVAEDKYLVSCNANLDVMFKKFKMKNINKEYESSTVSGWVLEELSKIPEVGDTFTFENLSVTVTKTDSRRVIEIEVTIT